MWIKLLILSAIFWSPNKGSAYKYASSLSIKEIERTVPDAFLPRTWPRDIFVTLSYPKDPSSLAPLTVFIVYKGNDSSRPVLSEVKITYGDSISELVQDLCKHGGWIGGDGDACRGVELMDSISYVMYGISYTPKRATSRIHDYVANRTTLLSLLINMQQYSSYLEIGCDDGVSFQAIANLANLRFQAIDRVVCVDPSETAIATHQLTSDAYFSQLLQFDGNNLPTLELFDCVFVDGLHEANQAFRDFMNSWRVLKPGGIVLMHDMAPVHEYTAAYPQHEKVQHFNWHGDVWKVVVALRLLPDAEVVTVDIDYGIAAVRKRPNRHPLSDAWKQYLGVNPLSMLEWKHYRDHKEELMRFVAMDEFFSWIKEEEEDMAEIEVSAE